MDQIYINREVAAFNSHHDIPKLNKKENEKQNNEQ